MTEFNFSKPDIQSGSTASQGSSTSDLSDQELNRVREIILGPDSIQQRFGKPEVERLREILFGEQAEDFERRFSDTRRDTERTLSDLRQVQDTVSSFEKSQRDRTDGLERQINQLGADIRRQAEQFRANQATVQQLRNEVHQQEMLTQKLMAQNKEQGMLVMQQEQELRTLKDTVEKYREQLERQVDTVKRESREAEDKLYVELRRLVDRLSEQKTDRKSLSAMFMEIATRLETGNTMSDLLEDLTGSQG